MHILLNVLYSLLCVQCKMKAIFSQFNIKAKDELKKRYIFNAIKLNICNILHECSCLIEFIK